MSSLQIWKSGTDVNVRDGDGTSVLRNNTVEANSLLGNNTGSTGPALSLTSSQVRTLLGLSTTDSPTFAGLTVTGSISANSTIQSNASSGFAIGGVAGLRRIAYSSTTFTRFTFLSDSNATERIAVDALSVGGSLASIQPPTNGIQSLGINRIHKAFVSSTNFEALDIDPTSDASNYRLGSRIGSAGGTTRGIQFGAYDAAGTWSSWLTLNTSSQLGIGIVSAGRTAQFHAASGASYAHFTTATSGSAFGDGLIVGLSGTSAFINNQENGPLTIQTNNTDRATFTQTGQVVFNSWIAWQPSSSLSFSTNGQIGIEMTSNTAGNLVYRGSDGVTRRMALTFT